MKKNKLKIKNWKQAGMTRSIFTQGHPEYSRGMTYIELIVVLGIFGIMSAIIMYNYGEFQAKVDIKNLASDIALKVVEAQKSSLNGKLPLLGSPFPTWNPSYGVHFNIATPNQFIYFIDSNNVNGYEAGGETLDTILITKNNYISNIDKCFAINCVPGSSRIDILHVFFKRPDSKAIFISSPSLTFTGSEYVQITIQSPRSITGKIKIYPSGRIQVN